MNRSWWYDCCMLSNKTDNPIVTELLSRGKKLNNFLVVIGQSFFAVPKNLY